MANDFSALCRNEGTGQRACHPQRIDDPGFGIIAERHGLERGVGKGVDRGPVVGALQSNLLVDEPVANLSVQPTERPRSPRPWWLSRRVSLDRDRSRPRGVAADTRETAGDHSPPELFVFSQSSGTAPETSGWLRWPGRTRICLRNLARDRKSTPVSTPRVEFVRALQDRLR